MDQLKVDTEPKKLLVTGEAYVRFTRFGYQPALDVREKKSKRQYYMFVSARSLANPLEQLRSENNGQFTGLEFWVWKKSGDRKAPYVVEE
jgi:hypothetical protein